MLTAIVGYAATALGFLQENRGAPVQVREIALACSIPLPYLHKIVRLLSAKGVVKTQRGVGGGVRLADDATTLTLHELCVLLDEPLLHPQCMLGQDTCSDDNACPAHAEALKIRELQLAVLQRTTIAHIGAFDQQRARRRARQTRARRKR